MTEGKKMDGEHTQKALMEITMKKYLGGGEKSQNYFCGQLGSADPHHGGGSRVGTQLLAIWVATSPAAPIGCMPKTTRRFKKGFEKVLGRVLGKGSGEGF